jgi:hypothetical protein
MNQKCYVLWTSPNCEFTLVCGGGSAAHVEVD